MIEWLVNGEVRVSTLLHLLSKYWDFIGAFLLIIVVLLCALVSRLKSKPR